MAIAKDAGINLDNSESDFLSAVSATVSNGDIATKKSMYIEELIIQITLKMQQLHKLSSEIDKIHEKVSLVDLTHYQQLDQKRCQIKEIIQHFNDIVNSKAKIIHELQHPMTKDCLTLHHDYHRYVVELFHMTASLINDSTKFVEDINWIAEQKWNENSNKLGDICKVNQKSVAETKQILFNLSSFRKDLQSLLKKNNSETDVIIY
ncbi:Uncharacterised protein g3419 [Pycnogonum litorale]